MAQSEGRGEVLPGTRVLPVHGRLSSQKKHKAVVLVFLPSPEEHWSRLRSRVWSTEPCVPLEMSTLLQLRLCSTGGVLSHQELCPGLLLPGLPWQEPDKQISLLENGITLNRYQPAALRADVSANKPGAPSFPEDLWTQWEAVSSIPFPGGEAALVLCPVSWH